MRKCLRLAHRHGRLVRGVAALAFTVVVAVAAAAPAGPGPGPAPGVASTPTVLREDFYRLDLAGAPAGWMVERRRLDDDLVTTETELELTVQRAGTPISLGMAGGFVETRDGEPVSMWSRQRMGRLPLEVAYTFHPDHLEMESRQGGSVTRRRLPLPEGPWRTPAQVDALVAAQVAAGAKSFTYRTLDPLLGLEAVEVRAEREAPPAQLELPGGTVMASRWRQSQLGAAPLESLLFLDAAGRMVKSLTTLLGVEAAVVLSDREAVRATDGEAPELMVRTFVRPDRPITAPRRVRRGVYRLAVPGGELPPLPTAGGQTVERRGAAARVVVTASGSSPAAGDLTAYRAASTYLNHRDPAVLALVAEALEGTGEGTAERAEALRGFVHGYLARKDLGTGFATASEVASLKTGDCTEHSVLLAALFRAAGIPSRLVGGLLYVEEFAGERHIFGYHMWVQAVVDGRWRDYDALTPRPFDAAHIALVTSALDDGDGFTSAGATLARLMGALSIEVLEVEP